MFKSLQKLVKIYKRRYKGMKIYLASKSPRRKEFLSLMGVEFESIASSKEENIKEKISLKSLSEKLAEQKADDIFSQTDGDRLVIGSDTLVCYKNMRFGKPTSEEDAFNMLKCLSGNWHRVISSLCVIVSRNGQTKKYLTHSITRVKFIELSDKMINDYIKSGEPMDKAGAYGIQGKASIFVEKIEGSYTSVIGLPTHELLSILRQENIL